MKSLQTPTCGFGAALCTQRVTLYHAAKTPQGLQKIYRTVLHRAFLEATQQNQLNAQGAQEQQGFLLVVPLWGTPAKAGEGTIPRYVPPHAFAALPEAARENCFTLAPGDKLCPGEGPLVPTPAAFAALLPAGADQLQVVQQVAVKTRCGRITHLEAQ